MTLDYSFPFFLSKKRENPPRIIGGGGEATLGYVRQVAEMVVILCKVVIFLPFLSASRFSFVKTPIGLHPWSLPAALEDNKVDV